jgi:hypothetical protein
MQTLVFNTTTKTVKLYEGKVESEILFTFENVPTVREKVGHYEIMQKTNGDTANSSVPVLRVPISNTNMLIEK